MQTREKAALSEDLKKRARLSRIRDYTFENYAVGHLSDTDRQKMMSLKTLAFMDARRNIVILGPDGTGKSHIAQAIGNECCEHGYRTLYLSASQFNSMARTAVKKGTVILHIEGNYRTLLLGERSVIIFTGVRK